MAESPRDIYGLGLEELKVLLVQALEEVARLKAENAKLREEIARLKGLKGRPKLKPSGMEKTAEAAAAKGGGRKRHRGAKRARLHIDETRIVKPDRLAEGARLKGYEDFIVQDLLIKPWTTRYRRERWLLPFWRDGGSRAAKGGKQPFRPRAQAFHLKPVRPGTGYHPALGRPA